MRQKPLGAFGAALVMLFLVLAIGAQWLAPYPYDVGTAADRLQGPSLAHPFGTDANGRDLLSRIIWGARVSVTIGFGAVLISTVVAVVVGVTSGYFGGWVDLLRAAVRRHLDLVPGAGAAGQSGGDRRAGPVEHDAGAGDAAGAGRRARGAQRGAGDARISRTSSRRAASGRATARIVLQLRLPNVSAPILVLATTQLGAAILAESTLELSGLWRAAAVSDLGLDAERHRARVHAPIAVACRSGPGWRSAARCSASTCSATRCETCSTRGCAGA